MPFGSTGGRGFEAAASPWVWGGVVVLGALLWLWFHIDLRRIRREEKERERRDREPD